MEDLFDITHFTCSWKADDFGKMSVLFSHEGFLPPAYSARTDGRGVVSRRAVDACPRRDWAFVPYIIACHQGSPHQ